MACSKKVPGYDWPRDATLLLITIFERYPELYVPTLPEYGNRNARQRALEEITKEFNKMKLTNLKLEDVKKKLHNVRTQFLAELQKIRKSEGSGASLDEVYIPKLWCFENLKFLHQGTQITSRGQSNLTENSQNTIEEEDRESTQEATEVETIFDGDIASLSEQEFEPMSPNISKPLRRLPSSSDTPSVTERGRKRKRNQMNDNQITGILTNASVALATLNEPSSDAVVEKVRKHQTFGNFIADELEEINKKELVDEAKFLIHKIIYETKKKDQNL